MIKLRDYQQDSISAIANDWQSGKKDCLLVMATGGGKTAIFLSLLNQVLTPDKRGLVLAHRKELIDQPLTRLYEYYPEWKIENGIGNPRAGIVMAEQNQPNAQLVIATVQSLQGKSRGLSGGTRVDDVLRYGKIDYLITDEAHHATAESYIEVYEKLKAANPEMRHLGVTATPMRGDGDGLSKVFTHVSAKYGIVELIKAGYLANVRWLAIQTKISLAGVASRAGDFAKGELANVYETDNCFDLVIESHRKYADGRQFLAFTTTVEGAGKLAEKFTAAGYPTGTANGTSGKEHREQVLHDYREGKLVGLVNVGLYTEGVDLPMCSAIHQVRPTQSDGLYVQIIGRALRLYPDKIDALIMDYAPVEARNIAMMGDILGCPLRKDAYTKPAEELEEGEVQAAFTFDGKFGYREGSAAEIVARQLDYLDVSPWAWHREGGYMSIGMGIGRDGIDRALLLDQNGGDEMTLWAMWRRPKPDQEGKFSKWESRVIGKGSFEAMTELATEKCNQHGNGTLAAKQRAWRKQPASEQQIKFAQTLKVWKDGDSRGLCAQKITHKLLIKALS